MTGSPDSRRHSAVRGVERGLIQVVLIWEALWMLFEQQLHPNSIAHTWIAVIMWVLIALWCATLLALLINPRRLRFQLWPQAVAIPLLLLAAVGVLVSGPANPMLGLGVLLCALSVAIAGLLIPWRQATGWLVLSCIAFIVALPHTSASAEVQFILVVIAVGSGAIGVRMSLLVAAAREDQIRAELLNGFVRSSVIAREDQVLQRAAQILHESVLNTLAAIVAGGAVADEHTLERLRSRARQSQLVVQLVTGDVDELEAEADRGWLRTLEPSLIELDILGVRSKVLVSGEVTAPPLVRGVLVGAVSEAIANVQRHAHATSVSIRIEEWINETGTASISAEIVDDGIGFDSPATSERFGVDGAIREAVSGVGGRVDIRSRPGIGTTVRIQWHHKEDQAIPEPVSAGLWTLAGAFVRPVIGALLALSLVSVVGGWAQDPNQLGTFSAYAALAALAGLVLVVGPRKEIQPWLAALIALASPVVIAMQSSAEAGVGAGVLGDWSAILVLGLLVVIAANGPYWAWLAALGSWALCQFVVVGSLDWPGVTAIALGGLYGLVMRRSGRNYLQAQDAIRAQEDAGVLASKAIADAQQKYRPLAQTQLDAVLGGIADGSLQADSPEVRRQCASLDGYIRALLRLDPVRDALHGAASQVALRGYQQDCIVDIALPASSGWAEGDRAELGRLAEICVDEMRLGTLRVTGGAEDGTAVARFVGSFSSGALAARAADALRRQLQSHSIGLTVTDDESSRSVMVEFRSRGYFANEHSTREVQSGAH
ncbi:MAG: hypothetical protein Q7K25_01030 [Actinomycetota bacterium]|nr:hypothetical protein [Actinomycetota bacterium]